MTPARLTFAGTILYVKGRGYHRQPWTKTDAGYRTLTLPRFAVQVLQHRQAEALAGGDAPVFPSRRGTGLSPHNVRRL